MSKSAVQLAPGLSPKPGADGSALTLYYFSPRFRPGCRYAPVVVGCPRTTENWTQPPERKVWHPIVWQQPPPPIPPDLYGKDAPHQQLIANIRRLLTETRTKPEERQKHIERMMLSLPTGSRREGEEDEEEPKPAPKPKKKKKSKAKKAKAAPRTRLDSETSEDGSVSELTGPAAAEPAEDPIPEEASVEA